MELLAKKFATAPVDPIEMAEFMRLLQNERSLKRLKALLPLNYVDCTGPVLARIAEIIPGDSKLYLSLALWNYHLGCDDQAFALLETPIISVLTSGFRSRVAPRRFTRNANNFWKDFQTTPGRWTCARHSKRMAKF
jgi:hypothetical protein